MHTVWYSDTIGYLDLADMAAGPNTFIFSDLVGFTVLAAERGDDDAAEVALAFHDRVRRLADAHPAEEIKTIGDGVMLRSEDPGDAIRLGLQIVRDLDEIEGFPAVRVGMHTGPAAHRAGDWYGTTVNVAARLCAAAGGGEVLASETTCGAAGKLADIEIQDRRLHWLKNVTDPVPAHLVEELPRTTACRGGQRWLKGLRRAQPQVACS